MTNILQILKKNYFTSLKSLFVENKHFCKWMSKGSQTDNFPSNRSEVLKISRICHMWGFVNLPRCKSAALLQIKICIWYLRFLVALRWVALCFKPYKRCKRPFHNFPFTIFSKSGPKNKNTLINSKLKSR